MKQRKDKHIDTEKKIDPIKASIRRVSNKIDIKRDLLKKQREDQLNKSKPISTSLNLNDRLGK